MQTKHETDNLNNWRHSYITTIGEIDGPVKCCCLEKNGKLAWRNRKEEQQKEYAEPVTDFGEIMAELEVLFQID